MNFRNGLEQLQRGARAGAGAQLAMAGPGYTLLAVDTHSGGISFGHTSPAGGGSSAATRCSSDYCQDPRITKNIIHLQALYTSEAAESYEEVSGGELRGGQQERSLQARIREGGRHT